MPPDPALIIHTGMDGHLSGQKPEDVRDVVSKIAAAERAVVHFHGGLVNRAKGTATAVRLNPVYRQAEATPVFFVWESGFFETISGSLRKIEKDWIFKFLSKTVLKHVVGKLRATAGQKATGQLPFPKDPELAIELQRLEAAEEPYDTLDVPDDLDETSAAERRQLERELERDLAFQAEVRAIAATALPAVRVEIDSSKGVPAIQRKSERTLLSPEVVQELEDDTEAGSKGLFTSSAPIVSAGKVLMRVMSRLRSGRDHGPYPTVVEEILREYYAANLGAAIWYQMKKETADTFVDNGAPKGGRLFVDTLGELARKGRRPKITLVGHSTGAVFILNLLRDVHRCRLDPNHPWPADFAFEQVVFLAPACNFTLLHQALEKHRETFRQFRMFAMLDEYEQKDRLLSVIYPRSLLYFVSGVVERELDGSGAFDLPLVGMERYYTNKAVYPMKEIGVARTFLAEDDRRAVWSIADHGEGLRSNSISHTGFDDTDTDHPEKHTTMASVQHLIRYGAVA